MVGYIIQAFKCTKKLYETIMRVMTQCSTLHWQVPSFLFWWCNYCTWWCLL